MTYTVWIKGKSR